VAKLLAEQRSELKGNLKLIFQPAEELPPGGALELIKRGVLDDPRVDAMFACHHATEFPVGQIGIHYGGFMASADQFSLTVVCRGGGGSAPHKGVDGIAVAAQIVTGLQYMLTRQIDPVKPAVLSFGTLHAGARFNILADRVEMTGTCRALDADTAERFPDRILKVAQGIAATYDAQVELKYERGYPTLANDDKVTAILEEAAKEAIGPSNVKVADPIMAGDDLAYFFRKVPGSYFWLGISNPAKGIIHPAHTARFDIDEEALPVAVAVMVQTVLKGFDHLPA
jgi:amidohydrolase